MVNQFKLKLLFLAIKIHPSGLPETDIRPATIYSIIDVGPLDAISRETPIFLRPLKPMLMLSG